MLDNRVLTKILTYYPNIFSTSKPTRFNP